MGEDVERDTLSSCEETMAKDKVDHTNAKNVTTRVDECFRARVAFGTLSNNDGCTIGINSDEALASFL